ncbi:phospholipase D-like domain-containing protein [Angustibacter sp. McL0619]|uniref:phospholipase D-like domain-containing protein n=1 Tax=Angustibacter sp. McL0619 TaxID=3415676 RepID=UPI003CED1E7A
MSSLGDSPDVLFLRDERHGGPPGQEATVAGAFADFVDAASTSLDVAIYDFRLDDANAVSTVVGALTGATDRGVVVRIGYDAGKPADATAQDFAELAADPAPIGTGVWVQEHFAGTGVQSTAIRGGSQLMHSKYLVRDAPGDEVASPPTAAVWTGSTNFTDDAWTRQENNIVTLSSGTLALAYRTDFEQMWSTGSISGTGKGDSGHTTVGGTDVGWDFCPGDGVAVNAAVAARVAAATDRVVVGAMVLTSHDVLAALADALGRGVPVSGIYDGGQMDPIVRQWRASGSTQVLASWDAVSPHLHVKHSIPYSPTSTHDFMHLKVLVTDDLVTTGSYNFSANAERNAENQITMADGGVAAAYVDYLDALVREYPASLT